MKKILFIFGTRPEAIKLAPLIKEFKKNPKKFKVYVAVTSQHKEMLEQVLVFFKIKYDFNLNIMKSNQTLFNITTDGLLGLEKIIDKIKPKIIIVQGDTTTAFIGALAGYYYKIKVAHIEAGLRTADKYSPFPEEINRRLISQLSDYHFTPTINATDNLHKEGFKKSVYNVGNTVIDALQLGLKIIKDSNINYENYFEKINFNKKIILVTGHRRENFGEPIKNICDAIIEIAKLFPEIEIIYPVHPNPNVKNIVEKKLNKIKNIHLLPPLEYPKLIWLMEKSYFIITDSGGIQEEAPFLNKPILITREKTERPEGVKAGTAILVGHNHSKIVKNSIKLLKDNNLYLKMSKSICPYGDGTSCKKITEILKKQK